MDKISAVVTLMLGGAWPPTTIMSPPGSSERAQFHLGVSRSPTFTHSLLSDWYK